MWPWERMSLCLAAVTCLLAGAAANYDESYDQFLKKHHDSPKTTIQSTDYCAIMMNFRVIYDSCKPYHIFIHAPEAHIQDVCGPGGFPYRGTRKRRSRKFYPLTVCRLAIVTRTQQCLYYSTFITRPLVLSCDENRLPVELDEVLTMSG